MSETLPRPHYPSAQLERIFREARTIAVVGASPDPFRPSHGVMGYLQAKGYRMIPVNPRALGQTILGEAVYGRLADVPPPVDLVEIFRASDAAGDAVDEAVAEAPRLGLRTIWMQLGVRNDAAAKRAEAAGLTVVMDRCMEIEYSRLFGTLRLTDLDPRPATSDP
jgi:predicted CoA-binding protein